MPRKPATKKESTSKKSSSSTTKKSKSETPVTLRRSERAIELEKKRAKENRAKIQKEIEESKETKTKSSPRKSKSSKSKSASHPPYINMIKKAIKANVGEGERDVVGYVTITKYIAANYSVGSNFKRFVKMALKKAVEEKLLVQVRNSFRLSSKAKKRSSSTSRSRSKSPAPRKTRSSSPAKKSKKSKESDESSSPKRKTRSSSADKKEKNDKKEKKSRSASESPAKKKKRSTSEEPKKRSTRNSTKSTTAEASPSPSPKKTATPKKRAAKKNATTVPTSPAPRGERNGVSVPSSKYDHVWQYEDGNWRNYDLNASDEVEKVYQGYLANRGDTDVRAVKSGQWEYMVDFAAMKQTNLQHPNHTIRNVRRVPNTGYVAPKGSVKETPEKEATGEKGKEEISNGEKETAASVETSN